ncbi:MAG: DUF945 family protein [Oleiphilaceae bacterium]|nr:DUF945 family protein [Oleiphilaceae bacterium]
MILWRRILLASALMLLLLAAVAPWLSGRLGESVYWQTLSELKAGFGDRLSVSGDYRRGYASAGARTRVTWRPAQEQSSVTVTLETDVRHGLTGLRSVTRASGALLADSDTAPELQLDVDLWRGLDGTFSLPALSWPASAPPQWSLEGLEGRVQWQRGRSLAFTASAGQFHGPGEEQNLSIHSLRLSLSAERRGEWFDGKLLWQAGDLRRGAVSLGPQQWQLRLEQFHDSSLEEVAMALDALYVQPEADSPVEEAGLRRDAFNRLSEGLQRLSVHGGQLHLAMDGGEEGLVARLGLGYPRLPDPAEQLPTSLLQHLRGEASVRVASDYQRRLPPQWQSLLWHWQEKGWLQPGPGGLQLEAQLRQQTLILNQDQPMELPPLL